MPTQLVLYLFTHSPFTFTFNLTFYLAYVIFNVLCFFFWNEINIYKFILRKSNFWHWDFFFSVFCCFCFYCVCVCNKRKQNLILFISFLIFVIWFCSIKKIFFSQLTFIYKCEGLVVLESNSQLIRMRTFSLEKDEDTYFTQDWMKCVKSHFIFFQLLNKKIRFSPGYLILGVCFFKKFSSL